MREYELEVLEQYDIEVISTRKTRGAYFCNTKEGLMLLGPAGISVGRAPLMYVLLCYLESRHGMKVDTPIFTKAGKLFSVSRHIFPFQQHVHRDDLNCVNGITFHILHHFLHRCFCTRLIEFYIQDIDLLIHLSHLYFFPSRKIVSKTRRFVKYFILFDDTRHLIVFFIYMFSTAARSIESPFV